MQVFSCEYHKIFKNTLFYRTPPAAVSNQILYKDHEVYFDNYFTSIPLLQHYTATKYKRLGKILVNRKNFKPKF